MTTHTECTLAGSIILLQFRVLWYSIDDFIDPLLLFRLSDENPPDCTFTLYAKFPGCKKSNTCDRSINLIKPCVIITFVTVQPGMDKLPATG